MGVNRETEHLLDAGDTLVGNLVSPLGASGAWNPNLIITQPVPNPDRILNLTAASKNGQMVTVGISAFNGVSVATADQGGPPGGQNYQFPSLAGPLTVRCEFGNGAQVIAVEIDVPVSGISALPLVVSSLPTDIPASQFINMIEGGTQFTVPGGVLRVYGRNDSNLVTPACSLFNNDIFGVPNSGGPGSGNIPRGMGPWWQGNPVNGPFAANEVVPVPASMRAVAAYFSRPTGQRSRNSKTIWVYNALPGNSDQVITSNDRPAIYFVPPFAKSVRVLRNNVTNGGTAEGPVASVDLYLYDQMITPYQPLEILSVAAGDPSPTFDLPMSVVAIGVLTGTAEITQLCLDFEIGI